MRRVQEAGTEVVQAKAGKGSATLSMAEAGARFTMCVVRALRGEGNPRVCSYVDTDGSAAVSFLAMPVVLGREGIVQRLPIGKLSETEQRAFEVATEALQKNIQDGERFVQSKL